MILSKKLSKYSSIKHAFFNQKGGKSKGIFKSLNCGIGSKDKKTNVRKNLEIVRRKISKNSKNIFLLHQIHSKKIFYINKKFKKYYLKPKADAIITDQRQLPIGVLTADCVPLLLFENNRKMIAAIHAGWKGALKGIINNVVNFMLKKGCKRKFINVAIGPCINIENYEVKKDFKNKFIRNNSKSRIFFKEKSKKIYFNLPHYVKSELEKNRIKNIDMLNIDTFNKKNNFFSARRSRNLGLNDYGRNISIIMIN